MDYSTGYVVFTILFVGGSVAYWVVTRAFKDPSRIYTSKPR